MARQAVPGARGAAAGRTPATASTGLDRARLRAFAHREGPRFERLLRAFVETPSVSADPAFSRHLQACVSLATDWRIISDTVWLSRSRPTITGGLRGTQSFRFILETGGEDRHSGDVGGAARNPLAELMDLAARLHDARSGRVKVPGFYRDVVRPGRRLLDEFRHSGFSLKTFRRTEGLRLIRTRDPLETMKRIWALPTFEVHGLLGGYAGPGVKAIVPGRAELKASCRLVPDQDPARIFRLVRDHVRRINPDVRILSAGSARPVLAETTGRGAEAVREAIRFGYGRRPAFVRDGGSIGAVVSLRRVLRAPVLFLGISLPEDGYHAPNESFAWSQAEGGIAAFARCLQPLASS